MEMAEGPDVEFSEGETCPEISKFRKTSEKEK